MTAPAAASAFISRLDDDGAQARRAGGALRRHPPEESHAEAARFQTGTTMVRRDVLENPAARYAEHKRKHCGFRLSCAAFAMPGVEVNQVNPASDNDPAAHFTQNGSVQNNRKNLSYRYYAVPAVLLAVACVIAIRTVYAVMAWHVAVPFSDEWDQFPRMIALREAGFPIGDLLPYLWQQHNEHRIFIPKLIYLIDLSLFSYLGYFPIVCIFVLEILAGSMLIWLLMGKVRTQWQLLLLTALVVTATFNLMQWENFASTFQTSFVGCFAFAVAAFVFYAKYTATGRWPYLCGTVIFALLSTLSLAPGLFVWILLALLAYLLSARRYVQSLFFFAAFVVALLLYLRDYASPGWHANPIDSLNHPVLVLNYLVVWLGTITGTSSSARLLGSIALFILAVVLAYVLHDGVKRRIEVYALLAICVFVLMSGFVTALARINFGVEQAMTSRYSTPVLILWLSLFCCLLLLALESPGPRQSGHCRSG
jgi:hypothetical protein